MIAVHGNTPHLACGLDIPYTFRFMRGGNIKNAQIVAMGGIEIVPFVGNIPIRTPIATFVSAFELILPPRFPASHSQRHQQQHSGTKQQEFQ